jgi:hypothetical protein
MGARIGKNVKIMKDAKIGQSDLLTIGDDVCIDNAMVRPFTLDEVTNGSVSYVTYNQRYSY